MVEAVVGPVQGQWGRAMIVQWAISLIMLTLFGVVASLNALMTWRFLRNPNLTGTLIPLAGGIIGFWGLNLLPVEGFARLAWLPLLLDLGCGPLVLGGLFDFLCCRRSSPSSGSDPKRPH